MSAHLQINAELQITTVELRLGHAKGYCGIAGLPLDHDRAQRRVGEVRQREHEPVDLEHFRADDVDTPCPFRRDDSERESFGCVHRPSLPGATAGIRPVRLEP